MGNQCKHTEHGGGTRKTTERQGKEGGREVGREGGREGGRVGGWEAGAGGSSAPLLTRRDYASSQSTEVEHGKTTGRKNNRDVQTNTCSPTSDSREATTREPRTRRRLHVRRATIFFYFKKRTMKKSWSSFVRASSIFFRRPPSFVRVPSFF